MVGNDTVVVGVSIGSTNSNIYLCCYESNIVLVLHSRWQEKVTSVSVIAHNLETHILADGVCLLDHLTTHSCDGCSNCNAEQW